MQLTQTCENINGKIWLKKLETGKNLWQYVKNISSKIVGYAQKPKGFWERIDKKYKQ